jgi:hypothetical protein
MKFVFVNDRTPRAPSTCGCCSKSLGMGYFRDLSSKRLYCDYNCYSGGTVPLAETSIVGLSTLGQRWADDFQRALLGSSDH